MFVLMNQQRVLCTTVPYLPGLTVPDLSLHDMIIAGKIDCLVERVFGIEGLEIGDGICSQIG